MTTHDLVNIESGRIRYVGFGDMICYLLFAMPQMFNHSELCILFTCYDYRFDYKSKILNSATLYLPFQVFEHTETSPFNPLKILLLNIDISAE